VVVAVGGVGVSGVRGGGGGEVGYLAERA